MRRKASRRANDSPSSTRAPRWPTRTPSRTRCGSELNEHFTDPELVELTFLIGYINMLNLFNNALEVRYSGEYQLLKSR